MSGRVKILSCRYVRQGKRTYRYDLCVAGIGLRQGT